MEIRNINAKTICETLDWIPYVSTASNLFHIFARTVLRVDPNSNYGLFLHKYSTVDHFWKAFPFYNIALKVIEFVERYVYLDFVKEDGYNLGRRLPPNLDFTKDYDVVLEAVKQNGRALSFASDELRNNYTIVLAAVKQNGYAIQHASQNLQSNRAIVLEAIKTTPYVFAHIDHFYWRQDRELILQAVRGYGRNLANSYEFCDDEEVVLAAINQDPRAIIYASPRLRLNREFNLRAIVQNPRFLNDVIAQFRDDRLFVLDAIRQNPAAYLYIADNFQDNQAFVLEAVQANGLVLEHLTEEFKGDIKIINAAIAQNPLSLQHARSLFSDFTEDRDVVLKAVKQNGLALQYASDALKTDPRIYKAAILQNKAAGQFVNPSIRNLAISLATIKQEQHLKDMQKLEALRIAVTHGF